LKDLKTPYGWSGAMNSQGSRELGKGLLEMACAPDGVTEAAEFFFGGAWQLGN
jgi:hypothetical protein